MVLKSIYNKPAWPKKEYAHERNRKHCTVLYFFGGFTGNDNIEYYSRQGDRPQAGDLFDECRPAAGFVFALLLL